MRRQRVQVALAEWQQLAQQLVEGHRRLEQWLGASSRSPALEPGLKLARYGARKLDQQFDTGGAVTDYFEWVILRGVEYVVAGRRVRNVRELAACIVAQQDRRTTPLRTDGQAAAGGA